MSKRAGSRGLAGSLATALLVSVLGCPNSDDAGSEKGPDTAQSPPPAHDPVEFRREAHAKALASLRTQIMPALRLLDPVAAAEVEGTAPPPPGIGAKPRADRRHALEPAQREAKGIKASLLSPEDGMTLRMLKHAIEHGREDLERPPWRDDPRALVHAIEPYLRTVDDRIAKGECTDGCGLPQLLESLRNGSSLGSASLPTVAAAREDLAALRLRVTRWTQGHPPEHALSQAGPPLAQVLATLDDDLGTAAKTLVDAPELPWARVVASAPPEAWKRRPARWGPQRLRAWLEYQEAYGREPQRLFDQAEATLARLGAMKARDKDRGTDEPPLPRPLDQAACETAWAPLAQWAKGNDPLVATLDCTVAVATLPLGPVTDAQFVLHLVERGIIEPTRTTRVQQTAPDIAMVRGRAAPVGQRALMQIAITAGTGRHRTAEFLALDQARLGLCTAAVAVWIHGRLGTDDALRARLSATACGDLTPLISAAEARPRTALTGLGLALIGSGPADDAALDRYWWAPMGMIRDLALPPPPPPQTVAPPVNIEELTPTPTPTP